MEDPDQHSPTKNDDSPEVRFKTKKELLEFLRAPEPGVQARKYVALTEAAERLGCRANDLLDEGLAGTRDIYAPVLEEELYGWPVTDRGMRHSQVLGMAFPVFRRRLNAGDKGILTRGDIERIRQGAPVIPEGYLLPDLTLRDIEAWEATQSETRDSERMRALIKTVAWIHPSLLKSEIGRWPAPTRMLGIGMLWVDVESIPIPTTPTIKELALAFEHRLGYANCRERITDWERIFQKPRQAMRRAKVETTQGKKGSWKPVLAGIALNEDYGYSWSDLNQAFKTHELLRPWWPNWVTSTRHLGNEKVDAPASESPSTSPLGGWKSL